MPHTGNINLETIDCTSSWRDVLDLKFSNGVLGRHVEKFLDFLERTRFKFDYQNLSTGEITRESLEGQTLFQRMARIRDEYNDLGLTPRFIRLRRMSSNGKFIMADHSRPYDGSEASGCNTAFIANLGVQGMAFPTSIGLGTDYLRGVRFLGIDGAYHPISVDQAVTHELAHHAYRETTETLPVRTESIITSCLGGVQRDFMTRRIDYKKMQNKGFYTLYDKAEAVRPATPQPHGTTSPTPFKLA